MNAVVPRSTFVTVVAALFMTFSGFGVLIGILQNLMLHLFLPLDDIRMQANAADLSAMPIAGWIFQYLPWLFALILLVNLLMFTASAGLLWRRNWGRLLFIGMQALNILWQIAGWFLQRQMFAPMMRVSELQQVPPEFTAQLQLMNSAMQIFGAVFALALIALSAWLIWRLRSPAIIAEFNHPRG